MAQQYWQGKEQARSENLISLGQRLNALARNCKAPRRSARVGDRPGYGIK